MTLDLKLEAFGVNRWLNILTVRKKGLQDEEYGSRLPTLKLTPSGKLEVSISLGIRNWPSRNWHWYSRKLDKNWFNLKLRHSDGKFQIYIDNVLKQKYINTVPQEWDDVELILGYGSRVHGLWFKIAEYKNFLYQGFSHGTFRFEV